MRSQLTTSLESQGVPNGRAASEAARLAQAQGGGGATSSIPHFVRLDFAYATRSVLYGMAMVMAIAGVVALLGLRAGLQEDPGVEGTAPADQGQAAPADV